ncbi:MAG: DUF1549 domain-containing protein, partial [Planctomycetaceae bacterium]|nr:DUF1549 domain-containing protein [Planctomycetaceae bacterium]
MSIRRFWVPASVVLLVGFLVAWASQSPLEKSPPGPTDEVENLPSITKQVDDYFAQRWQTAGLKPVEVLQDDDELQVYRRLSLALHGTIPSLEEIRRFEADQEPDRIARWAAAMLEDRRFADYFAERLARSFVGTDNGQFIVYRRDRFVTWLADELHQHRPYDQIVREMIQDEGLWTGSPATNFMTSAFNNGEFDENKLAGRTARAFLGQSMDCAQCHNHFFASWTQEQFQSLAAFYGQARLSLVGLNDRTKDKKGPIEYHYEKRMPGEDGEEIVEQVKIDPDVPFGEDWLPSEGTRRQRLAAWITHPENRRFERAIANRVWGLLFGEAFTTKHEDDDIEIRPVDDMLDPEPLTAEFSGDALDILGRDFREHDYDLRRMILAIVTSKPFRLSSDHSAKTQEEYELLENAWAVFPLTRLRPEQVVGSMLQAASIKTIDRNSHLFVRTIRFFREKDFVKNYGDLGADELQER